MESFFDIFRENNAQRSHLENVYWFRLCGKDYAFYTDQKTKRAAKCTAAVQKLTASGIRFKRRAASLESPSIRTRFE